METGTSISTKPSDLPVKQHRSDLASLRSFILQQVVDFATLRIPIKKYGKVVWLDSGKNPALLVEALAGSNGHPICSACDSPGLGCDILEPRMPEFVPLWNIAVFFVYALRPVNCETCGVKVEKVPWV